jgi:hypothetical protein
MMKHYASKPPSNHHGSKGSVVPNSTFGTSKNSIVEYTATQKGGSPTSKQDTRKSFDGGVKVLMETNSNQGLMELF